MYKYLIFSIGLAGLFNCSYAQVASSHPKTAVQNALQTEIVQIAKSVKAIVGVSVVEMEDQDSVSYNGNSRMVLQSVMKLPIAMTVLHLADVGKLKLDKTVKLKSSEYLKSASALKDKYPDGGIKIPVSELLSFMIVNSDNNACDLLLKTIDGPQTVENYMFSLGVKGISVKTSEADMAANWDVQFLNWAKPVQITRLLELLYQGKALSKANNDLLLSLMTATVTGPNRLKGALPAGTIVAHKTGSSATNAANLTPATNDAGIITLPNGKHLAIAVFVCNATEDEATREGVIAKIAKASFDYYSKK
jgi:beta-lactamase class A